MPSVQQFLKAIEQLSANKRITDSRRAMLKFHLECETLTAGELAEHMGWNSYGKANLEYGKLAHEICDDLKALGLTVNPPLQTNEGQPMWTSVIAEVLERGSERTNYEMRIDDSFAQATVL